MSDEICANLATLAFKEALLCVSHSRIRENHQKVRQTLPTRKRKQRIVASSLKKPGHGHRTLGGVNGGESVNRTVFSAQYRLLFTSSSSYLTPGTVEQC